MNKNHARSLIAEIREYCKMYGDKGNPTVSLPKVHIDALCAMVEKETKRRWWQI